MDAATVIVRYYLHLSLQNPTPPVAKSVPELLHWRRIIKSSNDSSMAMGKAVPPYGEEHRKLRAAAAHVTLLCGAISVRASRCQVLQA